MSGLLRYTQKLFGINAAENEMSQYGSRIASPPGNRYSGATINPDIVQSLSTFGQGQYAAMAGKKSPFIPDHNSLFYLTFYQLSYLLTRGIPEWDSGTTYNTNDFCKVGNVQYYSLIDNNTNNNPTSSPSDWKSNLFVPKGPTQTIIRTVSTPDNYITPPGVLYLRIQMAAGGGGGGGSGTSAGGNGTAGSISRFGDSMSPILLANPGEGGSSGPPYFPTPGGTSIFTEIPGSLFGLSFSGQYGSAGNGVSLPVPSSSEITLIGGNGGNSLFSGAGISGQLGTTNAIQNTGGGGGGAGLGVSSSSALEIVTGAGGGGGGWFDVILVNPDPSYPYILGAGGTGGTAGASGEAGGNGADGILIITEYY